MSSLISSVNEPKPESVALGKEANFCKDEVDVVIFHHPCNDGFASAYVVHLYYKLKNNNRNIDYIEANYGALWPYSRTAGKNVLIVDFSYPYSVLSMVLTRTDGPRSILIIDHHKTAENELSKLETEKIFDMNHSGCALTWKFFFGPVEMPLFLKMIEDHDLWRHKIEGTEQLTAFLRIQKLEFDLLDLLREEKFLGEAISQGKAYLDYENKLVQKGVKRAVVKFVQFKSAKRKIYAVVPHVESAECKSEIGNRLVLDYPLADFAVVYQYNPFNNLTLYSLRSCETGVDVSEISKEFLGGGGHRNASGAALKGAANCISHKEYANIGVYGLLKGTKFYTGISGNFNICCIIAPSEQLVKILGLYLLQKRYSRKIKATEQAKSSKLEIGSANPQIENAKLGEIKSVNPQTENAKLEEIKSVNPQTENAKVEEIEITTNNATHLYNLGKQTPDDCSNNSKGVYVVNVVNFQVLEEININIFFDNRFVTRSEVINDYVEIKKWKEVQEEYIKNISDYIECIKCKVISEL